MGIAAVVLLLVCGLTDVPAPARMMDGDPSPDFSRERRHVTQVERLQTRDSELQDEIRELSQALEDTKADLSSFRRVHDTLIAQVAATTAQVQELEGRLVDSKAQAAKLKEYAALQQQLQKERDEAVGQAKAAAERIRELTLKLQRAGVYR